MTSPARTPGVTSKQVAPGARVPNLLGPSFDESAPVRPPVAPAPPALPAPPNPPKSVPRSYCLRLSASERTS